MGKPLIPLLLATPGQAWNARKKCRSHLIRKNATIGYKTRNLARADVFDDIEVFYNRTLRHSHLGRISPKAFERAARGWALSTVLGTVH